jgi:predicted dinucleotide-utilizing enzyme
MHLGLIGYGSIGASLLGLLGGDVAPERITVLVRQGTRRHRRPRR